MSQTSIENSKNTYSVLDRSEKISKIIFQGIAATVIGLAGWQIQSGEFNLKKDEFCINYRNDYLEILKNIDSYAIAIRVGRPLKEILEKRCGFNDSGATKIVKNIEAEAERQRQSQIVSAFANDFIIGHSFIAKQVPIYFSDVNFGLASTSRPAVSQNGKINFKIGTILKARWSVNVRENTEDTSTGKNKIVGTIYEGQCVRVVNNPVEERGLYWAKVERSDCPTNTK